jgi:hypothetical protein
MNRRRWIIVIVVVGIASLPLIRYLYGEHLKRRLVNPAIEPAFVRIDNYSLRYLKTEAPNREEFVRCSRVVKEFFNLRRNRDIYSPNRSEYYGFLLSLHFKLPPYLLSEPATREEAREAKRRTKSLLQEQDEILIELYGGKRD